MYEKIAGLYDVLYSNLHDLKFWSAMAHHYGGPVLEIGCGTGRLMLELAKSGFDISGIDNSKDMLSVLKKKALKMGINPQIKHADMRDFSLDRMFRTVTVPFSTFLHLLTTKDQEAFLSSVRKHLLQEGILIIDVFNPDLDRPEQLLRHQITAKDGLGRTVSKFASQTFNKTLQVSHTHFFIDVTEKTGSLKRITVDFKHKYLFHRDLRQLLERNGFRIMETYGDYNKERFSERDSPRLIIAARKVK